jgi:hypothetical protein
VPGYETQSLYGLFAPARTPPDTINKIHTDLTEIIMRPGRQNAAGCPKF